MSFTVNDLVKIELQKDVVALVKYDPPTQMIYTERPIGGSKGLFWSLRLHRVAGPSIRVAIGFSVGSVKATGTIAIGADIQLGSITIGADSQRFETTFVQAEEHVVLEEASIVHLTGQFFVTVEVQLEIQKKFSKVKMLNLNVFELIAESQQDVTDAEFSFVDGKIKIHRGILSAISPVFYAMFTHDTKEAKTGVINITDFDMKTAKSVINLCYGRNVETESIPEVVDMLRFADKYDIKAVVKKLEAIIEADLDKFNFCAITQYAWDLDRDNLKTACGKYYRKNLDVCLTSEFGKMRVAAQVGVIAVASSIDSPTSGKK
uniref:BTB domain-containing protein n=1 Tax=Panagrellus redivivus TaxID=6233 RepID=A0A7E4VN03_PANRE